MKIVITIVGKDRVGIIAAISGVLSQHHINILNINQNIVDGFFNMVMIADMEKATLHLKALQQILREQGDTLHLDIKAQHEDIFNSMHRI